MSINYREIADKAVAYAASNGITLDFSKESIAKVEEILAVYNEHLAEYNDEDGRVTLWNLAVYFGIYLGETMLRVSLKDKGYEWFIQDGIPTLKKDTNEISPITKAHKRILNGPSDSVKSFCDVGFMIADGKFEPNKIYRAVDVNTATGQSIKNVLYADAGFYIDMVKNGQEDFIILKSHDGFLQFYGVDNSFVAEMHVNYANNDFRTFSFINRKKETISERIVLETPYGSFTPMVRDVISYEQIKDIVRNYYKHPVYEDFLKNVDYVETTEETKKYMG